MTAGKKQANKRNTIQIVALIGLLIVLISISVGSTLLATGVIGQTEEETQPITYIYDAELLCNQYIRNEFQDRLKGAFVDDFSSRLDESTGVYKMFYEVSVKRDVNTPSGVDTYLLNCFVNANGRLATFEFNKDKALAPKAKIRTSAHPFGL